MIQTFPDGETVELVRSGNGNPPDSDPSRQHTNCSTWWVRRSGGVWRHLNGVRTSIDARVVIQAAETADEAMAVLCPPS